MDLFTDVVTAYSAFAEVDSPCLAGWARELAGDPEVVAWVAALPQVKQQPNLVFAAARWHGVPAPGPYAALRVALLEDTGPVRETILTRSTQTNEAGRLATLLPAFAFAVPTGPVALVEVGASAGLCLFPDRYDYVWTGTGELRGSGGPVLTCAAQGPVPVPARHPDVVWRGGVDLHPLDVTDDDAMAWLATLVWPEHQDRLERLRQAVAIARREPPRLHTGDLLERLPDLVDEAAAYGTVVVFHSAVIAYLEEPDRDRFVATMTQLVGEGRCHWVSNEGEQVLPSVTETGPEVPPELMTFVLGLDGQALAWTQAHGRSIRWVAD